VNLSLVDLAAWAEDEKAMLRTKLELWILWQLYGEATKSQKVGLPRNWHLLEKVLTDHHHFHYYNQSY
jgi:hypothetical protein